MMPKDLNDMLRDVILTVPDSDIEPKTMTRKDFMEIVAFIDLHAQATIAELSAEQLKYTRRALDLMEQMIQDNPEIFPSESPEE